MDDVTAAKILISCLDLTSLGDNEREENIIRLCAETQTPFGQTAAVCIYPQFIPLALKELSSNVRIATVVNFPQGRTDKHKTQKEIKKALTAGADEIDAVFPYHAFLSGETALCRDFLLFIREQCGAALLKIILETGELKTSVKIKQAARMAIDCGADFIKTSTGKTAVSATPEAANAMLETIKASDRNVGFKASGGIRTLEEAKKYLVLAQSVLGPEWISPEHFRIGASSLLADLMKTINQGY